MTAPADRVWEIVGNPGTTPGRGIVVEVERPAAENGSGLVRAVRIGRGTFREQITSVGPGRRLTYRLLSGAPVREYLGTVDVAESGDGGSRVRWTVRYEPRFPGTGWLVAALEALAQQGPRPGRDAHETGTAARRRLIRKERRGSACQRAHTTKAAARAGWVSRP